MACVQHNANFMGAGDMYPSRIPKIKCQEVNIFIRVTAYFIGVTTL